MQKVYLSACRILRKNLRGGALNSFKFRSPWGKTHGVGFGDPTKTGQQDVLRRGGGLLREHFEETLEPGGQVEIGLPISQELVLPQSQLEKDKGIPLVRAGEIDCLNFRFATESLTKGESILHLFILTCDTMGCEELVCNNGIYKAVNPKCRKVLDGNDMFTMPIGFHAPINSICDKCLGGK